MNIDTPGKTVWELLWDYDPNGLIVVDRNLIVTIVNNSFCEMFHVLENDIIGRHASTVLDDADEFERMWNDDVIIRGREKEYRRHNLVVKKVMFPIRDQGIMACIMVDVTHEQAQKRELLRVKDQTLQNVSAVIDKQMQVAQEIASLLGETTAETKVNLLKLAAMLKKEEL